MINSTLKAKFNKTVNYHNYTHNKQRIFTLKTNYVN